MISPPRHFSNKIFPVAEGDETTSSYRDGGNESVTETQSISFASDKISKSTHLNLKIKPSDDKIHSKEETNMINAIDDEMVALTEMVNFLMEKGEDLRKNNQVVMHELEQLTRRVIEMHNDPALHRIIKSHGWSGSKYPRISQNNVFDVESYSKSLINLYLSRKTVSDAFKATSAHGDIAATEPEKILSYLPDTLIHHLTNSNTSDISCSTFTGAALLIDISGFSAFAANMCSKEKGVKGLNDLHDATNVFLGHLVTSVYRYGGDVIAFAGDAIICVFVNSQNTNSNDQVIDEGYESDEASNKDSYHSESFNNGIDSRNSDPPTIPLDEGIAFNAANFTKELNNQLEEIKNKSIRSVSSSEKNEEYQDSSTSADGLSIKNNLTSEDKVENSKPPTDPSSSISGISKSILAVPSAITRVISRNSPRDSIDISNMSLSTSRVATEISEMFQKAKDYVASSRVSRRNSGELPPRVPNTFSLPVDGHESNAEPNLEDLHKSFIISSSNTPSITPQTTNKDPYLKTNCCLRALECAISIREYEKVEYNLSVHIAASYGEMKLAILGGHNEDWIYLVNGKCISELSPCINAAQRKEIFATKECYEEALRSITDYSNTHVKSLKKIAALTGTGQVNDNSSNSNSASNIHSSLFSAAEVSFHDSVRSTNSDDNFTSPPKKKNANLSTSSSSQLISSITNASNRFRSGFTQQLSSQSNKAIFSNSIMSPVPIIDADVVYSSYENSEIEMYRILKVFSKTRPSTKVKRLKTLLNSSPHTVIDEARLFVSRPVLSAIYSDSLDRMAELREVVTMFVSLDSYSNDKMFDPLTLQPFFRIVQEALHQSGGYLRQFIVDDKGCVVIAMWGVPQFSYANNSVRGLFCGVAISKRISSQLGLICSIGLTSGYSYCGGVGCIHRRDYVVIGDQVNMAARLMSKAKGRILFGEMMKTTLPQEIIDQSLQIEPLKVKGKEEMLQPYAYTGDEMLSSIMNDDQEGPTTVLRRHVRSLLISQLDKFSNMHSAHVHHARLMGSMALMSSKLHLMHDKTTPSSSGAPSAHRQKSGNGKRLLSPSSFLFPDPRSDPSINVSQDKDHSTSHRSSVKSDESCATIIFGLPGTGKSTASQFFEQEARKRNIECLRVQARPGDDLKSYSIIRKLFLELVGISNFREESQQRQVIKDIIEEAYVNHPADDIRIAELTLEIILGVAWSEAYKNTMSDIQPGSSQSISDSLSPLPSIMTSPMGYTSLSSNMSSTKSDMGIFLSPSSTPSYQNHLSEIPTDFPFRPNNSNPSTRRNSAISKVPPPNVQLPQTSDSSNKKLRLKIGDMTFYNILRSKFKNKKIIIIIEDACNCDELSWNELNLILHGGDDLQVAMLLTMRSQPISNCIVAPSISPTNGSVYQSSDLDFVPQNKGNAATTINETEYVRVHKASGEVVFAPITEFHGANQTNAAMMRSGNDSGKYGLKFRPNSSYLSILVSDKTTMIEMNSLNKAEIKELLTGTFSSAIPQEIQGFVISSILEVTSGNAFWCKAIARYISDYGIEEYYRKIVERGDRSSSNPLTNLIVNRIDRLSAEQQTVIKHAAIIGDDFSFSILTRILPSRMQTHLLQSLEALQQFGLIYCVDEGNEDVSFSFQNQLIRNTIYDLTPPSDAATIHLAIGELIEFHYIDGLRLFYPSLSYHYRSCCNILKEKRPTALKYTLKSADQAISRGAYTDALTFLEIAKPHAETHDELKVFIAIVRVAIRDILPNKGLNFTDTFLSTMTGSIPSIDSAKLNILNQYKHLKGELQTMLDAKKQSIFFTTKPKVENSNTINRETSITITNLQAQQKSIADKIIESEVYKPTKLRGLAVQLSYVESRHDNDSNMLKFNCGVDPCCSIQ